MTLTIGNVRNECLDVFYAAWHAKTASNLRVKCQVYFIRAVSKDLLLNLAKHMRSNAMDQ